MLLIYFFFTFTYYFSRFFIRNIIIIHNPL